ncbi:uncharacterized protein [Euwallacea similis]|uniref:uncharacterized protein n=1 Tax=Euwallacea similis TaxID=1736056 RepID=UPI0034510490
MISFIFIVVVILASNAAPTPAQNTSITSKQLFAYWESVKESIRQTRNTILVKQDQEIIELMYEAQQIKMEVLEKFEIYNTAYRKVVKSILEEYDDTESIRCIMDLNDELIKFDQKVVELMEDRITEGESLINNFIYSLNVLLESISDLRTSVERCNKSYCTREIAALLSRTHEMVLQDIDTFEEELYDTFRYLILNEKPYVRYIQKLLSKLRLCIYGRIQTDHD